MSSPRERSDRRCNHCGNSRGEVIYEKAGWEQHVPNGLALVCCDQCGLMYLDPKPKLHELEQYYPEEYESYRPAIAKERSAILRYFRLRNVRKRRRMVEKYTRRIGGSILDVGCGTGIFLNEMRSAGWMVSGVEPSSFAVSYARKIFDLDIYQGVLEKTNFQMKTFDVITLWDVLEHTQSPSSTLKKIYSILEPSGWLIMNIPNAHSIDRRLFGPHWMGFDPPRHLYVFPTDTLWDMLETAGLQPVYWRSFLPSYFSFAMSLERWFAPRSPRMARWVGRASIIPGIRIFFEPYFALANHTLRSGLITVFAQKLPSENVHGSE